MSEFVDYIKKYTENKSVCILGFGREGKSTYNMIKKYCSPSKVTVCDLNPVDCGLLDSSDEVITGSDYQKSLDCFDLVFKSPGIVLEKSPDELKCVITSETQVFFTVFREQIIGITGTKGKSTVSSLIYHILKEAGNDTYLAGNIGIPVFDIAEQITDKSIVVCELSCHQLEYMTVSPKTAVFLNLYEEHLDHYGTMERYYSAKKNIYLHQKEYDDLLINYDIFPKEYHSWHMYSISDKNPDADVYVSGGKIKLKHHDGEYQIPVDRIKLLGVHNHYNIAVAYYILSFYLDLEDEKDIEVFTNALCTFNPLAHRLEYIGKKKGINWYDDSISTACATAIEAVKSVPDVKTILIGGMDRGIDYTSLVEFLSGTDINVICMERSGKRIYDIIQSTEFSSPERVHYAEHLKEAVELAGEITPQGSGCVLSPASASYGIFKNFEERGEVFKTFVYGLE